MDENIDIKWWGNGAQGAMGKILYELKDPKIGIGKMKYAIAYYTLVIQKMSINGFPISYNYELDVLCSSLDEGILRYTPIDENTISIFDFPYSIIYILKNDKLDIWKNIT